MSENKTTISNSNSYQDIGEFWSEHDLSDYWDQTHPVDFEVDIQSEKRYYPLEGDLADEVNIMARERGVTIETLLNLWVKEKIIEQKGLHKV